MGIGAGLAISAALSAAGGLLGSSSQQAAQRREYERQKEFAQNGIRWRVADAKAAGLHPLAALGTNVTSYSPQAAVGTDYGLSEIGQNIQRGIEAKQTQQERQLVNQLQTDLLSAQVEGQRLQNQAQRQNNDFAAMQMADSLFTVGHQQQVPPMPTTGRVYGAVDRQPSQEISALSPDFPHVEAGEGREVKNVPMPNGDVLPAPTDLMQDSASEGIGQLQWLMRRIRNAPKDMYYSLREGTYKHNPIFHSIQQALLKASDFNDIQRLYFAFQDYMKKDFKGQKMQKRAWWERLMFFPWLDELPASWYKFPWDK